MIRVAVRSELLRWAHERAGISQSKLEGRFPKLRAWETGDTQPTLKQVEAFARAVRVPVGYLFLSRPPEESVPIPDSRTIAGQAVARPSPDLLDTIYACQERQSWYMDFARATGQRPLAFIGSASPEMQTGMVASQMRETLNFPMSARRRCGTWEDALRLLIRQAEMAGILVMGSGIVGSNSHRRLDPDEFRGFALPDTLAPLVFVNGADTRAAQIFTLSHELAHLWLGAAALSDIGARPAEGARSEEVWCNAVAAEFLVPLEALRGELREGEAMPQAMSRLSRFFKVSTLVILRRLLDVGWVDRGTFEARWMQEIDHLRTVSQRRGGGGDFCRTTITRVGHRFAEAIVVSTLEGNTLYRDAFRMLGISRMETFNSLGRRTGVLK